MRWWLVGAWLFAAAVCGVVLLVDEHFVIRAEGTMYGPAIGFDLRTTYRFGCFAMTAEGDAESPDVAPATLVESYADGWTDADYRRLQRTGTVLFYVVCAAPILGLIALCGRGGNPAIRRGLLLITGAAPLAALQWFGRAVEILQARFEEDPFGPGIEWAFSLHATPTTWAARVAWSGLVLAAAVSWWRWPKRRKVSPVDPGVFE